MKLLTLFTVFCLPYFSYSSDSTKVTQVQAKFVKLSCHKGQDWNHGTVTLGDIKAEKGMSYKTEEVDFMMSKETCAELLLELQDCTNQYGIFTVHGGNYITDFSNLHIKKVGIVTCDII